MTIIIARKLEAIEGEEILFPQLYEQLHYTERGLVCKRYNLRAFGTTSGAICEVPLVLQKAPELFYLLFTLI